MTFRYNTLIDKLNVIGLNPMSRVSQQKQTGHEIAKYETYDVFSCNIALFVLNAVSTAPVLLDSPSPCWGNYQTSRNNSV